MKTSPPLAVLYEDNHLIAVFKPAGVLIQGDASGEPTLIDMTKAWIKQKCQKPGDVFLGLVHRLDRQVAGVVVFARTSKGASRLSAQIRARAVQKTYHALVEGRVADDSRRLVHWLTDDDGRVSVHERPSSGAKEARLGWTVLRREKDRTLLEIDLETGRKHQIRAQLAHVGHPIVGDTRYGARTTWPAGIALVSFRMRFKHTTEEREITVALPPALDPLG